MVDTLPSIPPDIGYQFDTVPRVLTNTFGDGYTQRLGDGINTMLRKGTLTWSNCPQTDRDTLIAFFKAQAGVTSFFWTPVNDTVQSRWLAKKWKDKFVIANCYTVSVDIEEAPDLS